MINKIKKSNTLPSEYIIKTYCGDQVDFIGSYINRRYIYGKFDFWKYFIVSPEFINGWNQFNIIPDSKLNFPVYEFNDWKIIIEGGFYSKKDYNKCLIKLFKKLNIM